MATNPIPIFASVIQSDTNPTINTIVLRDSAGGIYGNIVQGSDVITTGNITGNVVTKTSSFTAGAATDYLCDCTSGAIAVTLPTASANTGTQYWFTKKDSVTGNALTFTAAVGTTSLTAQYSHVRIFSDGTSWYSAA
jgi:hypothetical protein